MKKRLLSLALTLALLMSLLPTVALAAEPQEISSAAQFAAMDANGNYVLTADITITAPYGSSPDAFSGTFDGKGHTITLDISATTTYQGAFALLQNATVKNLSVDGTINTNLGYAAGIAAKATNSTIENCGVEVTITCTGSNSTVFGGVVGYGEGCTITNCYSTSEISGQIKNVGGIVGQLNTNASTIESCYNWGELSSTASTAKVGGIVGYGNKASTIKNCYTTASINSNAHGGAFFGHLAAGFTLSNCYYLEGAHSSAVGFTPAGTDISAIVEKSSADLKALSLTGFQSTETGYPILPWQTGSGEMDTTPSLKIKGVNTIYAKPGAGANTTTLTVSKSNMGSMTVSSVTWSIEKQGGGDASSIATLQAVENNKNSIVVLPVNGGVVTVTATLTADGEPYTASFDVNVIPNISAVTIVNVSEPGAVAVGQTVQAKVSIVGGGEYDYDNFPPLTYQWKHRTSSGISVTNIPDATGQTITIPSTFAQWDYLHVDVLCGTAVVAEAFLSVRSKDYGKLYPISSQYTMPTDVKDASPLNLPASITVGDITASIVWTSNNAAITKEGIVTPPDSGKTTGKLKATFTYGDALANREFPISVWSEAEVEDATNQSTSYLQTAADALGAWYSMTPVFGTDCNVTQMLSDKLSALGFSDITVTLKDTQEVYGDCAIATNGDITYFYADPADSRGLWFGRQNVTFTLEKDGAALDLEAVPVTIYWDINKVTNVMTQRVLDEVTDTAILASGDSTYAVTQNLTLPKVVENQLWTQIAWTSSDPGVISISNENQGTADTLFAPYVGKVSRGATDKTVILTAAFTFQRSNDIIGSEAPLVLYKTFTVTVKALSGGEADAARAELESKLNAGFTAKGLRDFVTENPLPESGSVYTAVNDIRLPTTADFGVDGKHFPITITSSDPDTLVPPDVANAARVEVFRPPVGAPAKNVTLTVTMYDKEKGISASKDFVISVQPLTQPEIDSELALMTKVKASYFEGIKNTNTAQDNITQNLRPFQEAYLNGSTLTWVYDNTDRTGTGIVPAPLDGWYDLQIWRLFKSSNAAVISHETLGVTRQAQAKAVTVESALSSEIYGKYGKLYLSDPATYSGYADLATLYYQPVSAGLIVRGTQNPGSNTATPETLRVSFTLQSADSTWIAKTTASNLPEGSTVFDLFSKSLTQNGYKYYTNGSYVYAVAHPNGTVLEELDEGANSGWMYKVNGKASSAYMAAQPLKNGDQIVVFFTSDYTQESSGGIGGGLGGELPKSEDYTIEPQEDKTYSVTLTKGKSGATSVSLPAVPVGHVVVIVNADGSETVVKKSFLENGTAHFLLEESVTIKIVPAEANFADVVAGDWFEDAVSFAASHALFNGISDDQFAPESAMTRGMLVTVLYRLEEATSFDSVSFPDVEADFWYSQAISWAADMSIVTGFEDGNFYPNENISRQQLVTILYGYAQHIGLDVSQVASLNQYTDKEQVEPYAKEAMQWAVAVGLVQGTSEGLLAPDASATRAETAVILQRLVKLLVLQ